MSTETDYAIYHTGITRYIWVVSQHHWMVAGAPTPVYAITAPHPTRFSSREAAERAIEEYQDPNVQQWCEVREYPGE
jgi:hypothetical protein